MTLIEKDKVELLKQKIIENSIQIAYLNFIDLYGDVRTKGVLAIEIL